MKGQTHGSSVEDKLLEQLGVIWADVLCQTSIGSEADFFEIGGSSLLMTQVFSIARSKGIDLSIKDLFDHPTLASLARHIAVTRHRVTDLGAVTAAQHNQPPPATNRIYRPPTTRLLRVLELCCKHSTYQELEQIWMETLEDHYKALDTGDMLKARFALWLGRCDLAFAAVNLLPSRLIQWITKVVVSAL